MGLRQFLQTVTPSRSEQIEFSAESEAGTFHYAGPAVPASYIAELRAAATPVGGKMTKPKIGFGSEEAVSSREVEGGEED